MRLYVQTRGFGREEDYRFLGCAPSERWWGAFGDLTNFQKPTVLFQSDGRNWRAYMGGLTSARQDATGTVIRYTLAADGACRSGTGEEVRQLLGHMASFLDEAVQEVASTSRTGASLDRAFEGVPLSDWLNAEQDAPISDLDSVLQTWLHDAAPIDSAAPAISQRCWSGALSSATCRAAWLAEALSLAGGRSGLAAYLNYAKPEHVRLFHQHAPVALLVKHGSEVPVVSEALPATPGLWPGLQAGNNATWWGAGAVAALVLLLLVTFR